ncbi:pullulanase-associated domain-containing protein [Bacillus sp. JCM 19034]|uniref:pullulanase-associated domain-containing protein n=1 Tax=Bacillus sp. JCM 19034 TaxID=1481928 RepID=UPI000783E3B7|nr:pullulanase-associated domain-containing protein [Bacillus sp. JCM 19034]
MKRKMMSVFLTFVLLFSMFTGYIPMSAQSESPVIHDDRTVEFYLEANHAERVRVAGSFTEWQEHAIEMEPLGNGGWLAKTESLIPEVYEYKYIVNDDEWIVDPINEEQRNGNSVFVVPGLNLEQIPAQLTIGSDQSLIVTNVSTNGEITEPDGVNWSLAEFVAGIELQGSTLRITEEAEVGSIVTLVAEFEGSNATKEIEIIDQLYSYTIHYHRINNELSGWNDLWIYNSGYDPNAYSFVETLGDEYHFATGTFAFPENEIEVIPRKGNWEAQDVNRVISIPDGASEVEAWLIEGDPNIYNSEEEAIAALTQTTPVERYIRFVYDRKDRKYDGWNLWVWGTGKQDDQINFTDWFGELAVANIEVSATTDRVGFILRDSEDWDTAQKDVDPDRFIQVNQIDPITKVFVKSGEVEFHTVPEVTGPIVANGDVTFYYRDPDLYLTDQMDTIEQVELAIFGERYKMSYEEANERFTFEYEGSYMVHMSIHFLSQLVDKSMR